jgi:alpha-beta hydrolase superfamily lysophospholipase
MRRAMLVVVLLTTTAAHAAPDLAKNGKLAVGVATVSVVDQNREGRTLPVEIWYPALKAERGAEPTGKRYPLILMAHGFCGSRLNYEYLTTHLASWGFVVAAPDFTGVTDAACAAGQVTATFDDLPEDLAFVCRVLHDSVGPLAQWASQVRGEPTGLVGHSLGGRAVVIAPTIEKSFTTVVGLAPAVRAADAQLVADLKQHVAWMVMGGTADTLVSFTDWTQPFFEGLLAPAFLVRVTDGTHSGFSDSDSRLTPEALAFQQNAVKRYATPFFLKYLAKKNKYARRLRATDDGTVALVARPK